MAKSCRFIDGQVALNRTITKDGEIYSTITFCNMMNPSNGIGCCFLLDKYDAKTKIDWEYLLDFRQKIRDDLKKGIVPQGCSGCYRLEDKQPEEHREITMLQIAAWEVCNSKCIYCESNYIKNYSFYLKKYGYNYLYNRFVEHYDVYSEVKTLIDKKILSKNARVDITGGEPTLYPKFDLLLSLLVDYGIKNIRIHTNSIIYSPAIEYALMKNCASMVVSVDAGSRSVHAKVKGVKSYDLVWENVAKYSEIVNFVQNDNNQEIDLKYIIIEGLNDNKKEIKLFLKKVKESGSKCVSFNLRDQFNRKMYFDKKLATRMVKLTEYAIKESKKLKLRVYLHPNIKDTYLRLNKEIPIA